MVWCSRRFPSPRSTTIGRKPHNDIQIDNLAVSGEHAVIVTILNDSFLEDLGSTNGTVVNGNPIKKHFLQNNDVIELGKYKLKFMGEAGQAASGATTSPTSRRPWCCGLRRRQPGETSRPSAGASRAAAAHRRGRLPRWPTRRTRPRPSRPRPRPRLPAPRGAASRRDPAPVRRQCRRARAHQASHHARQARRAGRGPHPPPAGLLHHPRRGRDARSVNGQQIGPAPRAQGPRRDRARRREDGILPKA